jgi:hypothetical protein
MDFDDNDPGRQEDLEKKLLQSLTIAIQGKGTKKTGNPLGSNSFQEGLASTPDLTTLGLNSYVTGYGGADVKPTTTPEKFKVMFSPDGRILTFDGAYPIDSNGAKCRYVIVLEADGPYLYADQCVSESLILTHEQVFNYPSLSSHGEIDGNVIGAGDMIVNQGYVIYLDSQSGSFQPGGANFAATLKLFVRTGLISENQIVTGDVDVAQYIASEGYLNIDDGILVDLIGQAMEGKLRSKTGAPTRVTPGRPQDSGSEKHSGPDNQDDSDESGGDTGVFDFDT